MSDKNEKYLIVWKKKNESISIRRIIFTLIIVVLSISLLIYYFFLLNKEISLVNRIFLLSDNSIIYFVDENSYIINYKMNEQNIYVKGSYQIDADKTSIVHEYDYYIKNISARYKLLFLKLKNKGLIINNTESDISVDNYYILTIIKNTNKRLVFDGYNVDTGIIIEFNEVVEELEKYIKVFEMVVK